MTGDSIHDRHRVWYNCQRCGHRHEQHSRYGPCEGYHCRCRGFIAIPEHKWPGYR